MHVIAQHCMSVKKKKNICISERRLDVPVTEELDRLTSTLLNCN